MRNVVQYPITSEEVIAALDEAQDDMQAKHERMIGSTMPYSLYLLCEFVRDEEPALQAFLERKAKDLRG